VPRRRTAAAAPTGASPMRYRRSMATPTSIAVFCGSSAGGRPEYVGAATALGRAMGERGITLVYGGASVGLMGAVADAALAAGGSVVGVIPEALQAREIEHRGLTEIHVVGSMHARKEMMAARAEAFVALPGGLGTLEELFEVWTWAMLGYHRKPCSLLDVGGYYGRLEGFLDHAVAEGFVRPVYREMLVVRDDPHALLDALAAYEPPQVTQWIGPAQR
jgi:uncharacterized protein (TIGR00730 family)